jgi:hypothetical protein
MDFRKYFENLSTNYLTVYPAALIAASAPASVRNHCINCAATH